MVLDRILGGGPVICSDPKVHDPHPAIRENWGVSASYICEGRTAPAPPDPPSVVTRGEGLDAYQLQDQRSSIEGRRAYDNRSGLPVGRDGDRLYGRRASDPR